MHITRENIDQVFPIDPSLHLNLSASSWSFALAILDHTPACADQQAALRHVREALMTAHAAVALKGLI
jgi:hypothetical protein